MKSVLISIQPKWCELIASGKKTVEVRKTKPKLETPFKVYIYCTNGKPLIKTAANSCFVDNAYIEGENLYGLYEKINGKVIGEFVCDKVVEFENSFFEPAFEETADLSCLDFEGLALYLGEKDYGYGWHISDLVIYDKPKELEEFKKYNRTEDDCKYSHLGYAIPKCEYCHGCQLTRPPQSWFFVEELKGE